MASGKLPLSTSGCITQIGLGVTSSDQNLLKLEFKYNAPGQTDNNGSMREQKITVPTVGGNAGFTAVQGYVCDSLNRIQSATENLTPVGGSSTQTWKQTFSIDRYGNRRFDYKWSRRRNHMKRAVHLALKVTLLSLLSIAVLHAQPREESILKRNIKIDIRASTWTAVHHLADKGIPIGIETREGWNVDTDPRVKLSSGRLEEILASIVKQDPSYKWELVDGVINFYPVAGRFEKSASFLATRLGAITIYPFDDRATIVERFSNLFANATADGTKAEIQFHSVIGRGNHLDLPDKCSKQIDITASDVRTALNKMVQCQPFSPMWTVTPSKDRKGIVVVF